MEAFTVFTTLAGIASCTQFVHGETDGLVRFFRDGTERHGSCHEVLHDVLDGFHLVDADGVLLPTHEVADEDRCLFLIDESGELLELLVIPRAGSELQGGDGFWVPGVLDAVLAPVELSEVGQE